MYKREKWEFFLTNVEYTSAFFIVVKNIASTLYCHDCGLSNIDFKIKYCDVCI